MEHEHNHSIGCTCKDCHEEEGHKFSIIKLIISGVLIAFGMVYEHFIEIGLIFNKEIDLLIIYLIAFLISGYNVIFNAIKKIFKGDFLDEMFLMTLASIAAFCVGEFEEGAIVMFLYQLGELLQDIAVDNSHKSIANLLDLSEAKVHVVKDDSIEDHLVKEVNIDEIILIRPGEKIPLDGIIIEGQSSLDMSSLTGESLPVDKTINDEVLSGSINLQSVLKIKVTKIYDDSTVNKILQCIENATMSKTQNEQFITKFSRIYTPIVVFAAFILAIIPPLFFGQNWNDWIYRACTFLVVSCPCALVISVPLAYFVGIGVLSTNGILMKGSNYLEILDQMNVMLFDKTGTLTKGKMHIDYIYPTTTEEELISSIAFAEVYSNHPIASLFDKNIGRDHLIKDYKEVFGKGIEVNVDGSIIKVGKLDFVTEEKVKSIEKTGTFVYASKDNKYLGYIIIKDTIKEDAIETIKLLKNIGVHTVMVSGDSKENAIEVGESLEIDDIHSELLPEEKVRVLEKYLVKNKNRVAFVGDGVNDAPSIAKSDVGIAMGGLGNNAAIEVSDIVVMNDSLSSLINAKKISKATVRIVKENIILIILVKAIALIFGSFGELPIWLAVLSDVGICLITIFNSLRLFFYSKRSK